LLKSVYYYKNQTRSNRFLGRLDSRRLGVLARRDLSRYDGVSAIGFRAAGSTDVLIAGGMPVGFFDEVRKLR
jgi:hypothetical protein